MFEFVHISELTGINRMSGIMNAVVVKGNERAELAEVTVPLLRSEYIQVKTVAIAVHSGKSNRINSKYNTDIL